MLVKESYDKIAKYFANTRVFTWLWTDNFINSLDKNSLILDIGSGNGRNTKYQKHLIFGLDISLEQLKMGINVSNVNNGINVSNESNGSNTTISIQGNMIILPFKSNSFDAILSIASFHHLSTIEERHNCLQEMKRILVSNGKMLLSVWSIHQPAKTKRKFDKYGDINVNWNTNIKDQYGNFIIIPRYYYIFQLNEIKELLSTYFTIEKYYWDCGNEIFELVNR
jgi:alkylated DNA repair protein alkB family protein 8